MAPSDRGGYYGCQTWQNQVAWALGGVMLPLGVIMAVVGTFRFTSCDFEYANCETGNWYQSSDMCYAQFVEECHGLRW